MDEIFVFLEAMQEAEEQGEHEFMCPLCGGDAWWKRSNYNGHFHAGCDKCGMLVME